MMTDLSSQKWQKQATWTASETMRKLDGSASRMYPGTLDKIQDMVLEEDEEEEEEDRDKTQI